MNRDPEKLRAMQRRSVEKWQKNRMEKAARGEVPRMKRGPGPAPVNRERRARRREAGEVYGPEYVRVANLPTCVGQRGRMEHRCVYYPDRRPEAHHVRTVGAGGKDAGNLVDVCHAMHDWIHDHAPSEITEALGFDLRAEAVRIAEEG